MLRGGIFVRDSQRDHPVGALLDDGFNPVIRVQVRGWFRGLMKCCLLVVLLLSRFVKKDMGSSSQFSRKKSKQSKLTKDPQLTTQVVSNDKKSESYSV